MPKSSTEAVMIKPPRAVKTLTVIALMVWTVLCYAGSLKGPFFFDDEHFILRNELVHSLAHIPDLYTSTVTQGAAIKGNFLPAQSTTRLQRALSLVW